MIKRLAVIFLLAFPPPAGAEDMQAFSKRVTVLFPQGVHPPPTVATDLRRVAQVPLIWRGQKIADIPMTPDMRADPQALSGWAEQNLNAGMRAAFHALAAKKPFAPLADFSAAGMAIEYDSHDAILRMTVAAAHLGPRALSLRGGAGPVGHPVVAPSPASVFVNLRGGLEYLHDGPAPDEGRQPLRLDIDGAINLRGLVLESRADYQEDAAAPWRRAETRVVYDRADRMQRIAAGDLSYPIAPFQTYRPLLGISVARNFTLQPYRVTVPAGETSFIVNTPSHIDILVNGRLLRSLRLDPGPYDISDFPVADGSNDVTLVITDAAGNVEQKTFPLVSDQQLLKKGLHEYAYNIGIAADTSGRSFSYAADRPALSLFHRAGLSDYATAGFSMQADRDVQQAGLSALRAFDIGTAGLALAASHADAGAGTAAEISFRRRQPRARRDFSALLRWRDERFSALGQPDSAGAPAVETALRYSQTVMQDLYLGLGGRYRIGHEAQADDWSYSMTASRTLNAGVNLSLTAEHSKASGAGLFLNVVWTPPASRHTLSAGLDSIAGRRDMQWVYRAAHDVRDVSAGAGVVQDDSGHAQVTGYAGYAGYRGEASLRHDVDTGLGGGEGMARSQLIFGTALVHAGGRTALARPVTGSFVMLAPHDTLSGFDVGINPAEGARRGSAVYQAEINRLGPAVLPSTTPYMYRPVRIDTSRLPAGYDIGRDQYVVLPGYKSGTLITVGHAKNIYADGYLRDEAGEPLALRGGLLARDDDAAAAQEFFTNARGRFRITGLSPGRYTLRLQDAAHSYLVQSFVVPKMPAGRFDVGTLTPVPEGWP